MLFMLIVSLALVSLSVADVTEPYGGCVTVSVLVHYFTLVAVMWMGAEALLMFQKLVIIFTRITKKFVVGISVVCWSKFLNIIMYIATRAAARYKPRACLCLLLQVCL